MRIEKKRYRQDRSADAGDRSADSGRKGTQRGRETRDETMGTTDKPDDDVDLGGGDGHTGAVGAASNWDPDWNFMPAGDASINSDTVTYDIDEGESSILDFVGEVDRRILAMAVRGVDLTEVYSPERVAKACK